MKLFGGMLVLRVNRPFFAPFQWCLDCVITGTDAEKSSGKIPKKDTLTFVPPALESKDLSFEPFHEKKQIQSFQTDTQ